MVNQWLINGLMMVNQWLMMVNNGLMMVNDIWLVVTGTMEFYDCPFHLWNNPSHWQTPSFFKMVKTHHQPVIQKPTFPKSIIFSEG